MVNLSVIIPTYNRLASLKSCLQRLLMQSFPKTDFEVIVVDDGSREKVDKDVLPCLRRLTILHQKHRGTAVARNRAIKIAKGNLILFIGDDIIADKNLIAVHYQKHRFYGDNYAVLGDIRCPEKYKKDLFMQWLYFSGILSDFGKLADGGLASYRQFYTGNISLKRKFLLKNGMFDENFKFNFEDTELGYRLVKRGLKIVFIKNAIVYHDHYITLAEFKHKMSVAGKSGFTFYQKHPELRGKIFPESLVWQEKLRLEIWHMLLPFGKLFNIRKIMFENYQRIIINSILSGYQSMLKPVQTP